MRRLQAPLLDTHVWIWYAGDQSRLDRAELDALDGLDFAVELDGIPDTFHRDPADRVIVATARAFSLPVLTRDRKIIDSRCPPDDTLTVRPHLTSRPGTAATARSRRSTEYGLGIAR